MRAAPCNFSGTLGKTYLIACGNSVTPSEVLTLFNDKAAKLEGSSFLRFVREHSLGFHFETVGDMVNVYVKGPHSEAVDAFVLTLRFFVQNNEPTSFANMAKLYDSLPLESAIVAQFHEGRAKVNAILAASSNMSVDDRELTNQEVFDVYLWGGLAHANPKYRAVFDSWAKDPFLWPLMDLAFNSTLVHLADFIAWVRDHNLIALERMDKLSPPEGAV